jgi:hypothetical protein
MRFLEIIKPLEELFDHLQVLQREIVILSICPNQSGSFQFPFAADQKASLRRLEYTL